MGIKNLHRFLKKHAPTAYTEINLSDLRGKRVAIDVNVYLFKFKSINRDKWMNSFTMFIHRLVHNGIDCVCVYDTKAPPEKNAKKEERKTRKRQIKDKIEEIETAIKEYADNGGVTVPDALSMFAESSMLTDSIIVNSINVENGLERLRRQVINVHKSDITMTKEFLDIYKIPYLDSDSEAETLCSHLCCHGKVDAVLSDDTDVLVYGTEMLLTKLNFSKETCIMVDGKKVLEELGLTHEQFVDLCIMSGTDYNDNIPQIGNEKAYKLIQKYTNLDSISDFYDVTILNFPRIREIFQIPNQVIDLMFPDRSLIDKKELYSFTRKYNLKYYFDD